MTTQNYLVRVCPRCAGLVQSNIHERIFCPHNCGFSGESDAYKLVVDDERVEKEIRNLTDLLLDHTHLSAYKIFCKNGK